ncbi:DMT family transporter [Psychrobacter sp. FDAARGOS_221]|uniref:DMT family transporter n=1 Tax=Psychrobacter sp. FDAARGOS_221 TaxID=1975705 RepID=UPI000BB55675|nr:DMT family transporter [Psychrobacter sp. FDAARGOS_221]PNK60203.1 EamA/RhaT family transporter [Psychrobacter sp. FDAARGOS_221]
MSQTHVHSEQQPPYAAVGLIIGCIIFGLGSLIVAHVEVGGFAMSFWRLAISGIVFTLLAVLFKQRMPDNISTQNKSKALIYGCLSGAFLGVDLALWHESIYAVGPGISTLLNSLQIFFLAALGYIIFKERQTLVQLISLFIALAGVVLIASPEFANNNHAAYGFITGIVSASMLAASMTFIRMTHQAAPTPIFILMQRVSLGGGLAMILPMLLLDGGKILPNSLSELGWIIIYGTVMQCLAWGLIAYSIPKLSLALTGLLLLSEPVAALVIDYFWLHKPINGAQWTGAMLTMFAIYLGSLKPKPLRQNTKLRRYRFFARFYRRR